MTAWRWLIISSYIVSATALFTAVLVSEQRDRVRRSRARLQQLPVVVRSPRERVPEPVRCRLVPAPEVAAARAIPRRAAAPEQHLRVL